MMTRTTASSTAIAIAVLFIAGSDALAQDPPPPDTTGDDSVVYVIPAIVVHATRPIATIGGASAFDAQLDSLRLGPVPTLEQVLREMPLVQIRQNSRGEAHFALRGASERQIAVLLDGVPLTIGWDHRADLSVVPMMAANNVRLSRGLSSVLHGPNVLGGVVEVQVARGPFPLEDPEPLAASTAVDHLGAVSASATAAERFEPGRGELTLRVGAGHRSSPGAVRPSGLPDSPAGGDRLRTNSDAEQTDGFLALRYRSPEDRWLSFTASGFTAERGVPPEEHEAEPRLWRYPEVGRLFAAASGGTGQRETRFGEGDLEASLGLELGRTSVDEYATLDYSDIVGGETGTDRKLTLRLLGDHTLGADGELRAAATVVDVHRDELLRPDPATELENEYQQRLWSVGGEVAWRLQELPLTGGMLHSARVSGGIAVDGASTPLTGGAPVRPPITELGGRVGLSALAGQDVSVHGAVSRRARFPSLRELYSSALGRFEPNPELGGEILNAAEFGATLDREPFELQAVVFHQRVTDAIVRTASERAEYRYKRVNRDEMRSTGVELLADWSWREFSLGGDVTLQRVRLLDPSVPEAARQAEYQPTVAGGLSLGLPLPYDVHASGGLEYMGRQWCVVPEAGERGMRLDPSAMTSIELSRGFAWTGALSRLDATLAVDNLTDAAVYDQCGLPRPGRTLRLQLRVR